MVDFFETSDPVCLFFNCRIFRDGHLEKNDLWIRGGKVIDPASVHHNADERLNCHGAIIAPGFIDLQVNGAYGVDFLTHPDLEKGLDEVCRRLPETGTTSFCPTFITAAPEDYQRTLPFLRNRIQTPEMGADIVGAHCEGPFLSKKKKGAHPENLIVPLRGGMKQIEETYGKDNLESISLITLAPENCDTEVITELTKRGVVVSLGHSITNLDTAEAAVKAGASKITHLFNAMLSFHHRDPSLPGLLVSSLPRELFFGVIADGIHTHPAVLRIAHRMRQTGLILVTDAIAAMGLPRGEYKLGNVVVNVDDAEEGDILKATVKGTNTLAGAVATLDKCVRYFRNATGCTLEHVLRAVTTRPARCLGISHRKGTLRFDSDADFVLLDDDLHVVATYIAGRRIFISTSKRKFLFTRSLSGASLCGSTKPGDSPVGHATPQFKSVSPVAAPGTTIDESNKLVDGPAVLA